jgi:disulfide bond formation protein DsbB
MYPLAAVIAVGLLRRDAQLHLYVLPLSVFGLVVSTYHYLVQKTDLFEHAIACHAGVPCTAIYVNWLGFITIPFMALAAFLIITLSMSACRGGEWAAALSGPPWRLVAASIAAVCAVFAVLYLTAA